MQILKDRIRKDGKIKAGNVLKVDSFLNHQMDIKLFGEIGKEFKRRFADVEVTKILTIEASGIGIACIVAQYFDVPVVFAKKTQTKNIAGEVYTTKWSPTPMAGFMISSCQESFWEPATRCCSLMTSWPMERLWRAWLPWYGIPALNW